VIARTLTLFPVVVILIRRFDVIDKKSMVGPDRAVLREIFGVAWPASTQFVVRMAAMLVTHSLVARAFTTLQDQTATTALGIVFRLETMALFVAMGWGSAAQTFVGQNLGAANPRRARQSGVFAAIYNGALMFLIALAYRRSATPVIAFFDPDPHVIGVAVGYVNIVSFCYLGLGTGVVLGSAITGAGATRLTLLTDLGVVLGFQIPACLLAVRIPGATLPRLWTVVALTYAVSGVVYVVVFQAARWMRSAEGRPRA
jgi:Na+-driven multidrug efflux pump